jgi:pimeloyl-ACP methyl ester carboxylesterase
MTLRRYAPLALAALAVGCQPKIESRENPAHIDFVAFDLSKEIDGVNTIMPQPSDVSLANAASLPVSAQRELLEMFAKNLGFPSDQEVPITIDFSRQLLQGKADEKIFTGTTVDLATVTSGSTVAIFQYAQGGAPLASPVRVDFDTPPTFTPGTGRGTLTLHRTKDAATGSRAWKADAQYVVFVRGGASGVKVTGGGEIHAWPTMRVILDAAATGKSLLDPANQGLLPGTPEEKAAAAARLEPLRAGFAALMPIALNPAGLNWPAAEIVSMQTFDVAPSPGTVVTVDSGSGIAPLPFDLMREAIPSDTTKPLDAGLVKPNAAFGAAGAGLVTLDGFSTTAMILAQTSGPITAASVPGNVKLFKRSCTGAPSVCTWSEVVALVKQPPQIQQGGFSVAIGIQPAVWTGSTALPPLAENTKYAVVVTDGVTDFTGTTSLARSTVAKILLEMTQPVVAPWPVAQGTNPSTLTPLLAGMDGQTAAGIQKMREELDELITDRSLNRDSIKAAYTFKTQSITGASLNLSAAPYSAEYGVTSAIFTPTAAAEIDPLTHFGIPAASFPNVAAFVEGTTNTLFALDLPTGALKPNSATWTPQTIPVLLAVPQSGLTTPCTPIASPLVVLHHGINGSRLTLLPLADRLAQDGFIVAAIDAPYHGARSYCNDDADCGGGTGSCQPVVAGATLAAVPGTCTSGTLDEASASGNYFISSNFFRTRDAIRQDLLDQSGLVLSLARPPAPWPQPAANPLATALAARCVAVDPTKVYFLGISLGGMIGTNVAATNPRVSRAVLNVAGGTLVDVFTNAPAFATEVDALFLSLGIDRSQIASNPAVAAAYLKTVNVAKWILDPADPINFAAGVATKYPSPIAPLLGALASTSTDTLGQASFGDTVVPNAFNDLLFTLALPGGTPPPTTAWATYVNTTGGSNGVVPHGVIGDTFTGTLGGQVRTDAADFLKSLTIPIDDDLGTAGIQVNLP